MTTIVNFSSIAPVPPSVVSLPELREILRGSRELLELYTEDELQDCLNSWETALCYAILEDGVPSSEWYTHALVCICLRGLRGDSMPKFTVIADGR